MLKKIGFTGLIALFLWSCSNEKVIQLPEIQHAKITEILDVSPAYIFYNETQPDSVELNRKNLIISTNWLFNVDKRLTLEQAIPKIKFLQNKKRNAKMHKNEAAKNYYTCNDTSIKNLGFIEFTDINYIEKNNPKNKSIISVKSLNDITVHHNDLKLLSVNIENLIIQLENNFSNNEDNTVLTLHLNKQLKFQDYITIKNKLQNLNFENVVIDNNEYIYQFNFIKFTKTDFTLEILDDILKFSLIDVIDVILVALLLYYVYKLVKGTVAINIFIGIVIIYIIWKVTQALQMQMLSNILGGFISVGMFALIVVFQQEIRKFLLMIGSTNFASRRKFFSQLKFLKMEENATTDINAIIAACNKMSASKTGALIVLERNNNLDFLANTGDEMNIKVTQPIIESIFFKNSPLHDGAIIIQDNIVKATRVILPVNNEKNIPQRFGLRHRAAVGVTERTDAVAIAVSEETGQISCFRDGEFVPFSDTTELAEILKKDLV